MVVDGALVGHDLTETTTMIVIAIIASFATVGSLCWLLFALSVNALPVMAGLGVGLWAHQAGTGIAASVAVGLTMAGATLAIGRFLLIALRPTWLKVAVTLAFVAPAALAGYLATYGIVRHLLPSEFWQIALAAIGSVVAGAAAFTRLSTATELSDRPVRSA